MSNSNERGSAEDRRRRRWWLINTFGDGFTAPCSFQPCDTVLTLNNMTVDRYPISGAEGGRYVRGNIRPACAFHNSSDGTAIKQKLNNK